MTMISNRKMKIVLMSLVLSATMLIFADEETKTIRDMEQDIAVLHNEYINLQKNPIVILGKKQEGLTPEQMKASVAYNMNIAQGADRKAYKTKKVVSINPIYICPIHKVQCTRDGKKRCFCKAMDRHGIANFGGLGSEYDGSFRAWNLLYDKIPEGEAQEKRLREIEEEEKSIKAEIQKKKMEQKTTAKQGSNEEKSATNKGKAEKGVKPRKKAM